MSAARVRRTSTSTHPRAFRRPPPDPDAAVMGGADREVRKAVAVDVAPAGERGPAKLVSILSRQPGAGIRQVHGAPGGPVDHVGGASVRALVGPGGPVDQVVDTVAFEVAGSRDGLAGLGAGPSAVQGSDRVVDRGAVEGVVGEEVGGTGDSPVDVGDPCADCDH